VFCVSKSLSTGSRPYASISPLLTMSVCGVWFDLVTHSSFVSALDCDDLRIRVPLEFIEQGQS
jgi:hypothetical protein